MNNPAHDVFAPFAPATPPVAPATDAETTNAPKGKPRKSGRKATTPRAPRTAPAMDMTPISPKTHQSAVQKTVIMVDAVTLLTSIQHLDQEATSVFMSALGAFQALKPVQRTQIAYALHQLFP